MTDDEFAKLVLICKMFKGKVVSVEDIERPAKDAATKKNS
jgi:hypothetical protein